MKRVMLVPMIMMSVSLMCGTLSGCSNPSSSDPSADAEQTAAAGAEETEEKATDEETASEAADKTADSAQPEALHDFLQERTGKTEFDSFDDIIGQLQPGEAYAYISVNGFDGDILAVTDFVYSWGNDSDHSSYVSTRASLYGADSDSGDGTITGLAYLETGDTGTPLYCSDGTLYVCNNHQFAKMQFDKDHVLYFTEQVVMEYAEDGTETFQGYTMPTRDTSKEVSITSLEEYSALFDVLETLSPVSFTRVEYESYNDVIDHLQEGELYAFFGIDGYDGELLATSDSTFEAKFQGLTGTIATGATIYAERDGKAEYVGMVSTGGTDYPIRNSNGILYVGNQEQYIEMKIQQNEDGKYVLYDVRYAGAAYDDKGNKSYETFDLESDAAESTVLKVSDDASFQALFTALENIPPVSFWTQDSGFGR